MVTKTICNIKNINLINNINKQQWNKYTYNIIMRFKNKDS